MRSIVILTAVIVFSALGFGFLDSPAVHATNPGIISFQGKVVNADGTNVTNGSYNFDFILWDDPTAGTNRWQELTKSVTVTNGVFQTNLGSATALPDFNAFPNLYLAVRFNADVNGYMTPRIQMASVPYALNADKVGGVAASSIVQLGATQSGNINISSGTITSGAINGQTVSSSANFTGTLAVAGASSLTLGTSASTDGAIIFKSSAVGSNTVTLQSPSTNPVASYILKLPGTAPSLSQCLQNDGTTIGQLIFSACGGGGSTLQGAYTASTGSTTPEIIADVTRNGLDIQDKTGGTIGASNSLLSVRGVGTATTFGASLFVVNASGKVGINNGGTTDTPTLSYDLSFGQNSGATLRTIGVEAQATAATAGNALTLSSGAGNTTGAGGLLTIQAGQGGATGVGGGLTITTGAGGATSGNSGALILQSGNVTTSGTAGNITLDVGTSTTGSPTVNIGTTNAASLVFGNVTNTTVLFNVKNTSPTAFQVKNGSGNELLTVDTTNSQLLLGKVGTGGINGKLAFNSATAGNFIVGLVASATTSANYNLVLPTALPGSTQCIQSTSAGVLGFASCGGGGTAKITLAPEFPGGVLTGDGTNNVGTMTSDFCSKTNTNPPDINTGVCVTAADFHNYYSWTASATNDYDIWVSWQVPSDFLSLATSPAITYYGWRTSVSDSVTLTMYDDVGGICGAATVISGTVAAWNNTNYATSSGCANILAGHRATFRIQLSVGVTNEFARMGEITINYNK